MTICEFMSQFCEPDNQKIEICDLKDGSTPFSGFYSDIPAKYDEMEMCSVDNIYADAIKENPNDPPLVFNIDTSV